MKVVFANLLLIVFAINFGSPCYAQFDEQANSQPNAATTPAVSSPAISAKPDENLAPVVEPEMVGKIFTDQGNGTFKHNKSGLIWMTDPTRVPVFKSWDEANTWLAKLESGQLGLNDGSKPGQWRIPTNAEWEFAADDENRGLRKNFHVGWPEKNASGTPEMYSRGYIGKGVNGDRWDGKYDLTVWGNGGRDSGSVGGRGGYVWPVRSSVSPTNSGTTNATAAVKKTVTAGTYVAIESKLARSGTRNTTIWEVFEVDADFEVLLSKKPVRTNNNVGIVKYCREQAYKFLNTAKINGDESLTPPGAIKTGEGYSKTTSAIYLVEGKWVSEGRIQVYHLTDQTKIEVNQTVKFKFRRGVTKNPDFRN